MTEVNPRPSLVMEDQKIKQMVFTRRDFLKLAGVTLASAGLGAACTPTATQPATQPTTTQPPSLVRLSDSRLAMVWRRVSSLEPIKAMFGNVIGWPQIGEDTYSVILDGGGTLIGYWVQDIPALQADDSCSELNYELYDLIGNPASELVIAPRKLIEEGASMEEFENSAVSLGETLGISIKAVQGSGGVALPFFDPGGNLSSIYYPFDAALAPSDSAGVKLNTLLKNRNVLDGQGSGVLGHMLLVSDMGRSQDFYQSTLGLHPLQGGSEGVKFDVGATILSIQQEPEAGLVESLNKSGRLLGDWLVFHVQDVERTMNDLANDGVIFPQGIEKSGIGQIAYFQDPDGHSLVLWQPSGAITDGQPIDFYPALDRILKEQS